MITDSAGVALHAAGVWPEKPCGIGPPEPSQREAPHRAAIVHAIRLAFGTSSRLHEARDWREVLQAAVVEKCAPLAWIRSGAAISAAAPLEISAAFRSYFVANTARVRSMLAAACATAAALEREGISPIWLKGPPLAARLYGDSAARVCSDLDWFVSSASLKTLHRVMVCEGWTRIEGEVYGDPCYARAGAQGQIYLEVHSSLLHARYSYLPLPVPSSTRVVIEGMAIRAHDDALLPGYLSAHLATHRCAPLAWLIDLCELWDSLGSLQRADARRAAKGAGVDRYLSWALRRATLLRCAATGDQVAPDLPGFGDRGRVEPHPMWRHIALAPGIAASARAARSWIAPPWVTPQGAGWVTTMATRIVTHWREALQLGRGFHGT